MQRELPPVEPFCVGWQFPLFELRPDLDPEKMKKSNAGRKHQYDPKEILYAIKDTSPENPVSVSEWAGMLNINRSTLNGYVTNLRSQGWIVTVGEAKQARKYITQKGRKQL